MTSRLTLPAVTMLALAGGVVFACSDSTPPRPVDKSGTFFGSVTQVAGGSGRAYVTLDREGTPTDIGVALTEGALTGLPTSAPEFVFALPPEASLTPYKNAVVNWQPVGHPPPGVYTVPHFDVHFYMITDQQRQAITSADPEYAAKVARHPAAEFIGAGYAAGMPSERMGLHWNDPNAPERQGQPFTMTFIYGSYDGAVTFSEPMVAKSFLETKPARSETRIKLPSRFAATGYQPTTYVVYYDQATKEYRVALTGLVQR